MVTSDWDLTLKCVCGPKFRSLWLENSPVFPATSFIKLKTKQIVQRQPPAPGCFRSRKFSTDLSPSRNIRQVQNTTSYQNSGTMNLNSIKISAVRGHAPYKYTLRNTMPKSPSTNSNPIRISWSFFVLMITSLDTVTQVSIKFRKKKKVNKIMGIGIEHNSNNTHENGDKCVRMWR